MKRPIYNLALYETYWFASTIDRVLRDQMAYLRTLETFYGDGQASSFAGAFPRVSALHRFIAFTVEELLFDDLDSDLDQLQDTVAYRDASGDRDTRLLPMEGALAAHQIEHTNFASWLAEQGKTLATADAEDIDDYYSDLRLEGTVDALVDRVTRDVFFVLFQNRSLLLRFNSMMGDAIQSLSINEIEPDDRRWFNSKGRLKRVRAPDWASRAVFFRDRGLCVLCQTDLSALVSVGFDKALDHIVPLALGGLNDVTNLQLLCGQCNRRKSGGRLSTSERYELWYEPETQQIDKGSAFTPAWALFPAISSLRREGCER